MSETLSGVDREGVERLCDVVPADSELSGTLKADSQIEADLRAIILSVAGQNAYATVDLERAHGCRTSATLRIKRPLTQTHFSGQNDEEEVIYRVVEGSVSLAVRKLLDYAESWVTARFGRDA